MRHQSNKFLTIMGAAAVFACANFAQADWATLDSEHSSVTYVTTKLKDISEIHTFESISGSISDAGQVTVLIDAASVNSNLELRDERMREFLYAVMDYPTIAITATVDLDDLTESETRMQLPAEVDIKGTKFNVTIDAFVSIGSSGMTVSSAQPVVVFASQAGLTEGVAKLSELAGGIAIGGSVPVSFSLSFDWDY